MRKTTGIVAAALALCTGSAARADVVEASSTTMIRVGQETRDGLPGAKPDLVTVAPLYEILSISAREIANPVADDLQVVLSTWGSVDLGDRRWDDGTNGDVTGDVVTGYVRGALLKRHLVLSVGRQYVAQGVARMIQLDGGEAIVQLPVGLGVQAYAGSPVSQRFQRRTELVSWNPAGGDLAYGGRVFWRYGIDGEPGRGVELGASWAYVSDQGDVARDDVGLDLRIQPVDLLTLTANATWSAVESSTEDAASARLQPWKDRLAEFNVGVTMIPVRKLSVTAEFRRIAPDLFLPRTSILSVFSDKERTGGGLAATYRLTRAIVLSAEGHVDTEPKSDDPAKTYLGSDAAVRATWKRAETTAGVEVNYLDADDNGYVGARLFGRQQWGAIFAALDLLGDVFREDINGQKTTATATLTAGWAFAPAWSAVVSARAGATAFLEQELDVMAKLVYNQTYHVREVR